MTKAVRIKLSILATLMLAVCVAAFSPTIYAAAPNLPGSGGVTLTPECNETHIG